MGSNPILSATFLKVKRKRQEGTPRALAKKVNMFFMNATIWRSTQVVTRRPC